LFSPSFYSTVFPVVSPITFFWLWCGVFFKFTGLNSYGNIKTAGCYYDPPTVLVVGKRQRQKPIIWKKYL